MTIQFKKAVRHQSKLRLAITGPSGSGKTYGALQIAMGLGGKIAVIDTEKGSASLYSHMCDFDVLELKPPYSPERFIEAIQAAEQAGYNNLIMDSITHEWSGVGGCLELVDGIAKAKYKGNSWSAWNEVTPRHRSFIDTLLRSDMHIIATMRSKTETVQAEENGRKKVVKLGMKAEQRDGTDFEFTTVLDLVHDGHYANASKDRTGLFTGKDPVRLSPDTGKMLLAWLSSAEAEKAQAEPQGPVVSWADPYLDAINTARDMTELKSAYDAAVAQNKKQGDADTASRIAAAKDDRKIALTPPPVETEMEDAV